jgi:translation initiation factor 3 subunit I
VWYSNNGERLGTYNGHNGTVWDLDITCKFAFSLSFSLPLCSLNFFCTDNSRYLLTGSADNSAKMWEVETGRCVFSWETKTAVRAVAFALGDEKALFVTDATMGQKCMIHIVFIEADIEDRT